MPARPYRFTIDFPGNPTAVHRAGSQIIGSVIIEQKENINVRGIRLQFCGEAKVQWREAPGLAECLLYRPGDDDSSMISYFGLDQICDYDISLLGPLSGPFKTIASGKHQFDFSLKLPGSCPSSFKGEYGEIKYYLTATLEMYPKSSMVTQRVITVNGVVDLAANPLSSTPLQVATTQTIGFWCCKAGCINANVRLTRQGFAPGEPIPLCLEVSNASTVEIRNVSVQLVQMVTFRARHYSWHSKITKDVIGNWVDDRYILPASDRENEVQLLIPEVPTTLSGCKVISISYHLIITICTGGISRNMKIDLPVIIGSEALI